jgi:hypothetical protein
MSAIAVFAMSNLSCNVARYVNVDSIASKGKALCRVRVEAGLDLIWAYDEDGRAGVWKA